MADIYPKDILIAAVNLYWGGPLTIGRIAVALSTDELKIIPSTLWEVLKAKGVQLRKRGEEVYVDHTKRKQGLWKVDPGRLPLMPQQRRGLKILIHHDEITVKWIEDELGIRSGSSRVNELIRDYGLDVMKGWKIVSNRWDEKCQIRTYNLLDKAQGLKLLELRGGNGTG